jgi:tetratricopeptide (TPR) repeat protein/SAM-dependent methyltransferase
MKLTIDQILQQGINAHKEGKLKEADLLYRAILRSEPRHPDANHNLGLISVSLNKIDSALPFFKNALEANSKVEQFWLSYIGALIEKNQYETVKQVLEQAKNNGLTGEKIDILEKQSLLLAQGENSNKISPSRRQLENLLESYKKKQYVNAEKLALSMTQQFPEHQFAWKVLGIVFWEIGKKPESLNAKQKAVQLAPQDVESHYNLGNTLKEMGRLKEAEASYRKATSLKPDHAKAYFNLGTTLQELGRLKEAEASYRQAISLEPDYAKSHNNLGNSLQELGRLKEAEASYRQAISLEPDYADAYYNLGTILHQLDRSGEAVVMYTQAITLKPDYAVAHSNMGAALTNAGDLEAAIKSYKKAIKLNPDFAQAYYNMGVVFKRKGDIDAAIENYKLALKIEPDYAEANNNMGNALNGFVFSKPSSGMKEVIISILDRKTYVRPSDISPAIISLLKLEPVIKNLLEKPSIGELRQSLKEVILDLSRIPLLLKLMSICPISCLDLENVLTDIRCRLLSSIFVIEGSPEVLHFQSALALQCFTNEYIYNQTENENKEIERLESSIKQCLLKGEQPSFQSILCLASYRPLYKYEWCDLLTVNSEIEDVFTRQVLEPKQESLLRPYIPVLQEITDTVSSKVREQYEASPYPRWFNLGLNLNPVSISKIIDNVNLRLFDTTVNGVETPYILIAGCGTGQHSIGSAARFKNSKMLAVDLSLSSLAYAKRKTEELGFQNIDYMQADILDLGKLGRQFDIVESSGVLHHMHEPIAGWRVLKDCLRSGGLMKIGLYSDLARQHIVKIREEIEKSDIGSKASQKNMLILKFLQS